MQMSTFQAFITNQKTILLFHKNSEMTFTLLHGPRQMTITDMMSTHSRTPQRNFFRKSTVSAHVCDVCDVQLFKISVSLGKN